MEICFSKRAERIEEGIFTILNEKKEALLREGREVFNFSVGTPDFRTPEHIIRAMEAACGEPENYKYALTDRDEMLDAVRMFYKKRFGVELYREQIMSLYGSQEGMAHIALVLCDPGDVVLVPNPGYPVFGMGPELMGAKCVGYPLYEKNHFLPDFEDIEEDVARAAKFMILSYPANPVCAMRFMSGRLHLRKSIRLCCCMIMRMRILSMVERQGSLFCRIRGRWRLGLSSIRFQSPTI